MGKMAETNAEISKSKSPSLDKNLSQTSLPTRSFLRAIYRVVQLKLTQQIEVFYMLFARCHIENAKKSLKLHIKYFNSTKTKFKTKHEGWRATSCIHLRHAAASLAARSAFREILFTDK